MQPTIFISHLRPRRLFSFSAIIFSVVAVAVFFMYNQRPQDLSETPDSQITSILSGNSDAKEYIKNHTDFKIDKKEILTKESIGAGKNGANFREIYQGLDLQDNRYMKVDLINLAGNAGLIAVIDFKKKETVRAYGILLLNANGQATSQTKN